MALTAGEIINAVYKGHKNLLTPHLVRYGRLTRSHVYELSWGLSFDNTHRIYGVTVVQVVDEATRTCKAVEDLSDSFDSLHEAEQYICDLISRLNAN